MVCLSTLIRRIHENQIFHEYAGLAAFVQFGAEEYNLGTALYRR